MPDIIDNANDQAELILALELQKRRAPGPKATGFCLACAERVVAEQRWCDVDCHADYERVERAKTRNGGSL